MESTSTNGTVQQEQVSVDRISHHCSFAGCNKSYSRKYRLNEHQKLEHGVADSYCTRNFRCPFCYEESAFRTNIELLNHCEGIHNEKLGKLVNMHIQCMVYAVEVK